MTSEQLFRWVIESPVLKERTGISQEQLRNVSFNEDSGIPIIEAIKVIIRGNESLLLGDAIFINLKKVLQIL